MELGPSLAPELLASADPLSRGLPEVLRPPGKAPDADSAAAPFELLLQMLGNRLPDRLPGGETLPAGGTALDSADAGAPGTGPAAALDPAAQGTAPILVAPPAPLAAAGAASALALDSIGLSEPPSTALAQALRAALAGARTAERAAVPPTVSPAADTTTASAQAAATGTDAPAAAPLPTPGASSAAGAETPADLDVLFALDPAARSAAAPAAELFALRPRAPEDNRGRAPAERAVALASGLASADGAFARMDAPRAGDLGLDAPVAATAVKNARLADPLPIDVGAPRAGTDISAAGSSTAWAPPALNHAANGTASAAAQPSAQSAANLGTPVDTQSARWHDALASRIQWLVDHAIGEAQIRLNPPELGALDVKISMLDDKTFVQMTAHTSAARDELAQSLPRLRELMSAGGLDLGGATVSGGRDDRSGYAAAAHPAIRAQAFASDSAEVGTDALPRLRLASSSRIDLFA